jgi:hypothetical protein
MAQTCIIPYSSMGLITGTTVAYLTKNPLFIFAGMIIGYEIGKFLKHNQTLETSKKIIYTFGLSLYVSICIQYIVKISQSEQ